MNLARFIAILTFRWQPAQFPLRLREKILPRWVSSLPKISVSLKSTYLTLDLQNLH
jgi:hypothetical protein